MTSRTSACLLTALLLPLTSMAAPPVQSALQASARLRSASTGAEAMAAVKAVTEACRGKLRHALRDHAGLLASAQKLAAASDPEVRRAALDLDRCFTPPTFVRVVAPRLEDTAQPVLIYAAEVAARMADPVVVAPLLAALDTRKAACLEPGLGKPEVEVCVWLTYAPGAALASADASTRAAAADQARAMFASPYAKVREVAVETVAAAGLASHAGAIKALIKDEKSGRFSSPNDAALLGRFEQRRRALLKP